jgi:hypothetical protein
MPYRDSRTALDGRKLLLVKRHLPLKHKVDGPSQFVGEDR